MKKEFKYKLRRLVFMYIPSFLILDTLGFIALVKAGIYVIG